MPKGRCGYFGHHWGPWPHGYPSYGPPPWGAGPCCWRRPSQEDEKLALDEYLEALKEEIQAVEAYRKDLEENPPGSA